MRAIFISYRREDSEGQAGRLFDDLVVQFGPDSVFMDVTGIEPGRDFRRAIDEHVATCGVLLAMIGKNWLDAKDESGRRRLDDPMDFVRLETASALKRDIPVIPVLVRGATMPRAEQLPPDLTDLSYRNAVELSHARWDSDVKVLVDALRPHVSPIREDVRSPKSAPGVTASLGMVSPAPQITAPSRPNQRTKTAALIIAAISLGIILIAAVVGYLSFGRMSKTAQEEKAAATQGEVPIDPANPTGNVQGGATGTASPARDAPGAVPTPTQDAVGQIPTPTPVPSQTETGLPTSYTLAGKWEDDEGKVFATVAASGESGAFEMEQIKPPKEHDTFWKATLKGRDVEIDVFSMPSGSHQMHMELSLSLDGNRMAGLLHPGGASPEFPPSPVRFRRIK